MRIGAPLDAAAAAALLREGGVLAYPTEGVWGLGCDPANETAVLRLLAIKQRDPGKGLILIAASVPQLDGVVDWGALPAQARDAVLASWPGPSTWIMPALPGLPRWITGNHAGIAVRVSAHPLVRALCEAFGGAIVSTSANTSGMPAPGRREALEPAVLARIDGVTEGETGNLPGPTPIRHAHDGSVLR